MWKDFENALQKIEKEYDTDIDGAYGLLSLKFKDPKWHIVSDLFGGMSNNKAKGRYGHNNSYWKKPGALEREAFAHFFGTIARSDEEKFLLLYKYFPLSMDAFLEMLL